MNEGYQDWYKIGKGCCLLCLKAKPGCSCSDCNCKKCYWYDPNLTGDSPCKRGKMLRENAKMRYVKELKEKEHKKFLDDEKTKLQYGVAEKTERPFELKIEKPYEFFTCQGCGLEFPINLKKHGHDNSLLIIQGVSPLCYKCLKENSGRKN